jgi:ferritin-like metal-binding protein YciE
MARRTTKKSGGAASARGRAAKTAGGRATRKATKRASGGSSKQAAGGRRSIGSRIRAGLRSVVSREPKNLGDLFLEVLKDMYHAEKQILRALPKMAKAAQSTQLKQAFEGHRQQTDDHVKRLERIFELSNQKPKAKTCHAIQGLVEEGEEVMKDFKGSDALDAGLLAAAQAVEHYEISRYGTLKAWAEQHGMHEVARLLDATLEEEKRTDALLSGIAERNVNRQAQAA